MSDPYQKHNDQEMVPMQRSDGEWQMLLYLSKKEISAITKERDALKAGYLEAIEDIESWAGYASAYFQDKHDLRGCLEKHRTRTTTGEG